MRSILSALLVVAAAPAPTTIIIPKQHEPLPAVASPARADTESADEIAKNSERDLKESRFYNKPGATRADYDRDWQACRLIARGTLTPTGGYVYTYNPGVVSPIAGAVGGGIGGMIGAAIIEGQQRRANRRACLLFHGWRLVQVPETESARVAAMAASERRAYLDGIIGASDVQGRHVTGWVGNLQPSDISAEVTK